VPLKEREGEVVFQPMVEIVEMSSKSLESPGNKDPFDDL
jgi:hypothetical protein